MGGETAVLTRHVTVRYGHRAALLDCSVSMDRGRLIGILGPNGAGKSTLVKVVLGLVQPDLGSAVVLGQPPGTQPQRVAYVPQRSGIDWDFPILVREAVADGRLGLRPWWRGPSPADTAAVADALGEVGLMHVADRPVGELSGGQQQRVMLARSLASGAELLVLDEPFAGVDAASERSITAVLRRLCNAGRTVLVVHHDLATAASRFDELLLLRRRVLAYGPPDVVLVPHLLAEAYDAGMRIGRADDPAPAGGAAAHA